MHKVFFLWFMYCEINRSNLSIAEKANQLIIPYKSYKRPTKKPHRIDLPFSLWSGYYGFGILSTAHWKKKMLWRKMHLCSTLFFLQLILCQPKSLYISHRVSYFLSNRIWELVRGRGNTENFCNFAKVPYFW